MEGIVIIVIGIGVVVALAVMARGKVGIGDTADIEAQQDIPRRPARTLGTWVGGPGYDLLDDKTGDAGVRPRVD